MPPDIFLIIAVLAIIWCGFLTFHELRQRETDISRTLEANAEIDTNPILQEWDSTHGTCRAFYVAVRNPSARPLRDVTVLLTETKPRIPNIDWLPIPLHLKHDNREPYTQSFSLNPKGIRHIDLVSKPNAYNELTIEHVVDGVNKRAPLGNYILTIRVEGPEIAIPREAKYSIRIDADGRLVCLPASTGTVNKGLLEFMADAKKAASEFPRVMGRLAQATSLVAKVSGEASSRINQSLEQRLSARYRIFGIRTNEEMIMKVVAPTISRRIDLAKDRLELAGDKYKATAVSMIENFDGYLGLTEHIPQSQFNALRGLHETLAASHASLENWRQSVIAVRKMSFSTPINKSLDDLIAVLVELASTTANIVNSFSDLTKIAQAKLPPNGKA